MWTNMHFCSRLAQFFLEWEIFQTKVAEKIETLIVCSKAFFFFKSSPLWYNVKNIVEPLKNIVEPDMPQMTLCRMRIDCWILKTARTHARTYTHTHTHTLLRETYIACLVYTVSFPGCVMAFYQLQRYSAASGVSWLIELRELRIQLSGSVLSYRPCVGVEIARKLMEILSGYLVFCVAMFTSCGVILPQDHLQFAFRLAF